MDSENSNLVKLIFPIKCSENLDYDINFIDYISKLGTFKIDDLNKEPLRLKKESKSILEQTQELAVTNYKTFIETTQCSRELFKQFNSLEIKLDDLLISIPKFENECKLFADNTSGVNNLRRLNSLTLTRSAQLLEILELPQLMNNFINDGLYEDSLELANYVKRLHNKHPDIPVFKSILDDVDKMWYLMMQQLINQLQQDLTLPKCLQIISLLRRMGIFTETELRVKFLQARNAYLENCLKFIPKNDVNHHLTKTIEVTRVNLFSIITQYKAVFNDDDDNNSLAPFKSQDVNPNVIFFSWVRDKIYKFLFILEDDLNCINNMSSIDSILTQSMYFGQSFSKVGCDFRPLMIPIFTKFIINKFNNSIKFALKNFEKNMERFTLINKYHSIIIPWKNTDDGPLQAPDTLLEFYPLAEFTNNILIALNELRLCSPLSIVNNIVKCLENALIFISKSILILYGQEHQAFTQNSKDAFTRLCMCFADDLVPYIQKCIHIIFPSNTIATYLGISIKILQDKNISYLNKNLIIQSISHLLPAKIDPLIDDNSGKLCEENVDDC